ncbi:hypothetical protein MTO96_045395 [Rhipicephalus appendiculatus]
MAVPAVPATFAAAFAFLKAAYDERRRLRREVEDAFDMPDDAFRRHFRLTVSKCVRRVARAIVNAGIRNKWVHFPRTPEEKAAVKEGFLRLGPLPGVIGCVDGSFIAIVAPKGKQKAAFFCRKGYYALNVMFICDAAMRILAVDPLRPGSDHDSHIWGTTWLRERFADGRIDTTGEYLLAPLKPAAASHIPRSFSQSPQEKAIGAGAALVVLKK